MRSPYEILIKPVITEKSTDMSARAKPQYVFEVHPSANKVEIRRAVEAAFGVHVTQVNTINMLGKQRRVRYQLGRTARRRVHDEFLVFRQISRYLNLLTRE